jgi:uncharacterized membrane protein YphA (DoxX/SURF4 family)
MESFRSLERWAVANRDLGLEAVRIYLGIGLFVKGLQFTQDTDFLMQILRDHQTGQFRFNFLDTFIAHYIPLAHLGGGLLLVAGLLTRVSAAFQLPVLFGAAFYVYGTEGIFGHNQNFQFTALVLFLLFLMLIFGGGRLSVDHHLRKR